MLKIIICFVTKPQKNTPLKNRPPPFGWNNLTNFQNKKVLRKMHTHSPSKQQSFVSFLKNKKNHKNKQRSFSFKLFQQVESSSCVLELLGCMPCTLPSLLKNLFPKSFKRFRSTLCLADDVASKYTHLHCFLMHTFHSCLSLFLHRPSLLQVLLLGCSS